MFINLMSFARRFFNWVKTFSATHRSELKARTVRALQQLRAVHHTVITEARKIDRAYQSELRIKAALVRLDQHLLDLTAQLQRAIERANESLARQLSDETSRLHARKANYERAVNLVRQRINLARHGWAKLEKEAKAAYAGLRANLDGAQPRWAKYVGFAADRLLQNVARERRRVAERMTASALLYDGRDLSPALARLRRNQPFA